MPWQGVSPMELRMRFITEYLTELYSMSELAAAYGVSRKTGYYWVRQYERHGPGRLAGGSRRPHTMPRATPVDMVAQLVAARRRHPTWGAGKLRDWLVRRAPATAWPCRDTIHTLLTRAGAIRGAAPGAARRRAPASPDDPDACQSRLDRRLQRRILHGRWRLVLSVDAARWV